MLRKLLRHSNLLCLILTGVAWLATIVARFWLLNMQVPSDDWLLWIVSNNIMVAGFAYQLGVISFRREGERRKWFRRGAHIGPGRKRAERHAKRRTAHGLVKGAKAAHVEYVPGDATGLGG